MTNEKVQVCLAFVPEPMETDVTISPIRIPTSLPSSMSGTGFLPKRLEARRPISNISPALNQLQRFLVDQQPRAQLHGAHPYDRHLHHMDLHPHMMTHLLRTSSASLSFGCMDVWSEEELRGPLDLDEMDDDMKFAIESCESSCASCRTIITTADSQ
jgi:hypothetical protein